MNGKRERRLWIQKEDEKKKMAEERVYQKGVEKKVLKKK